MAITSSKGTLKGLVGPGYYRELNGKQIFQTKPRRSKQKKSKNVNAKLMKGVSHYSSLIRLEIETHLNKRHESYMHSRFVGQLMRIVSNEKTVELNDKSIFSVNCKEFEGFEFNRKTMFKDVFLEEIAVTPLDNEALQVHIPAFVPKEQIIFPKGCTEALIRLAAFTLFPNFHKYSGEIRREIMVEFTKEDALVEEINWTCLLSDMEDKFEVIVADIQFFYPINNTGNRTALYNSKAYNPSMVVYAK